MTEERELLPCPFCGRQARFVERTDDQIWLVECSGNLEQLCGAYVAGDDLTEAADLWNARAKEAATTPSDTEERPWDPWTEMGVDYGGYDSVVDQNAIWVLKAIRKGVRDGGCYYTRIAELTGLANEHVMLWQYLFCSAHWCDYGTSPRGCFPDGEIDFNALIAKWEAYYRNHWKEEPEPAPWERKP